MAEQRSPLVPILLGGAIAGALDIIYAFIFTYVRRGTSPVRVLQSVASGALGQSAFQQGAKAAALGLAFHFLIAVVAAAVYFFASRVLRVLITHPVVCGIFYGLCVYLVMNCVVLRISAIQSTTWPWSYPKSVLIGGLLIHMFGIGLPIALVVRRYSNQQSRHGNE